MRAAAHTASRIPAPAVVQSVSSKTVSAAVTVRRIRVIAVESVSSLPAHIASAARPASKPVANAAGSAGSRPVKAASAAQFVARPSAVAARLVTRPTVCAARTARNPARSVAEDVLRTTAVVNVVNFVSVYKEIVNTLRKLQSWSRR